MDKIENDSDSPIMYVGLCIYWHQEMKTLLSFVLHICSI